MDHRPFATDLLHQSLQASNHIKALLHPWPVAHTAIITGSGLGALAEAVDIHATLDASDIPGLGTSTVSGHGGRWHHAEIAGHPVLILEGRRHIYEGISAARAALPIYHLAHLDVENLILTNAAGGLSPRLKVGDLMLLDDHINLMARNPLISPMAQKSGDHWDNKEPSPRFPDMSQPYDPELSQIIMNSALDLGIGLQRGVYIGLTGPNYETAAEVRMLRLMGADAVGMSTVPEVIAARQLGLRVAAVSLITNSHVASTQPPSHDEVLQAGRRSAQKLASLLCRSLEMMDQD